MFDAGFFTSAAGIWRRDDDSRSSPFPGAGIPDRDRSGAHPGRHGPAPGAAEDAASHYGGGEALGLFQLEQDASIADQVDLSTITKIVMTHLHFDHAGGLALLPARSRVLQRREWEAGRDADASPGTSTTRGLRRRPRPLVLVDGDHDLLGDGSIDCCHPRPHARPPVGPRRRPAGDRRRRLPLRVRARRPPVPAVRRRLRRPGRLGRSPARPSRRRGRRPPGT